MNLAKPTRPYQTPPASGKFGGFTLVELLVLVALIGILSSILLSALAKAKTRAHAIFCLNNTRQLIGAWHMYAGDNNGKLVYNFGADVSISRLASVPRGPSADVNWVNNVETWDLSPDNTNTAAITGSSLGLYTESAAIYRCPADTALSPVQRNAGWDHRIRSYSMNAMVGDAGPASATGVNINNPDCTQFFRENLIQEPSEIFVFLDEHPDSISSGFFVNQDTPSPKSTVLKWNSLPASYHNGAASFSFADGHAELHRWACKSTKKPAVVGGAGLPFPLLKSELADYKWVLNHMSEVQGN